MGEGNRRVMGMGVIHFMGLGLSPGVVTSPVAYLNFRYRRGNETDKRFFAISGERGQVNGRGNIESVVLFTTERVRLGQDRSWEHKVNSLGESQGRTVPKDEMAVGEVIQDFFQEEFRNYPKRKFVFYWCDIDRFDFRLTFERVAQAVLSFSPPEKVGKEIWLNLTGGTNVINVALQIAGSLSGLAGRIYYVNSPDPRLLRPPLTLNDVGTEKDHYWVSFPLLKFAFDERYYAVLDRLTSRRKHFTTDELLSELKGDPRFSGYFSAVTSDALKREILNKMREFVELDQGQEVVSITQAGFDLLSYIQGNLLTQLVERGKSLGAERFAERQKFLLQSGWFHEEEL